MNDIDEEIDDDIPSMQRGKTKVMKITTEITKNKTEIQKSFLDGIKDFSRDFFKYVGIIIEKPSEEQIFFQNLRNVNPNSQLGIECIICYDKYIPEHIIECIANKNHIICRRCFVNYYSSLDKNERICCYDKTCSALYDRQVLKNNMPPSVFYRFDKNQSEFDQIIALGENVEKILYCKCGVVAVIEKNQTGNNIITCPCGETYCLKCEMNAHPGMICLPPKQTLKQQSIQWINNNTKLCPKCKVSVQKNGGCNHMTCKCCYKEFCWICLGNWPKCVCR